MAKTSYLNMINKILKRITQPTVTAVSGVTGHALIISEMINEAQLSIYSEHADWYSLFKVRTFQVIPVLSKTTISFSGNIITDTGNNFGDLLAGMMIVVSGSTSNDGIYRVVTASSSSLTLQSSDSLTTEAAGESVSIYIAGYPIASDFGRSISLIDITNDRILVESFGKYLDNIDPNNDELNIPLRFVYQDAAYRLYPIPSATTKFVDRYYSLPTALSVDADVSDLPIEAEDAIVQWALAETLEYLGQFEKAAAAFKKYERTVGKAISANDNIISRMDILQDPYGHNKNSLPVLPIQYGAKRFI